jgi:hypothetical protein
MALRRLIVRGYANMGKVHAWGPVSCAAAAALAACAVEPKAEAPAGFTLAGHWKLDHAASDDPQKLIATMHEEAYREIARHNAAAAGGGQPAGGRGGAGGVQTPDETGPFAGVTASGHSAHGAARPDPLRRSPMMHILTAALERGDFLTVRVSETQFVLDYGTSVRSFTPGEHSVVSAETGVADQVSGWKGHEYLIEDKAQLGPSVTERYSLSSDGQHLVERLRIGPAELPAVELKRVYDRTEETAPQAVPSTD